MNAAPYAVEVLELRKAYGEVLAVGGVSLAVRAGEIVSLLGPSGCGKTTTLRAIAGFEHPDAGEIRLAGTAVTGVPANRRGIGMVFQGYALFPHLSVFENVAFGLKMRKRPAREIAERVSAALETVRLSGYERRLPRELSGGQQQRVALARALAFEPVVLLLDEPLSNLDAKLRAEMQVELKRILTSTGVAAIFVTHDQEEAMALSDRIVVMNAGVIEQSGTPREIYERPATRFVASFIGRANFFEGTAIARDGERVTLDVAGTAIRGIARGIAPPSGAPATLAVRQERVVMAARADGLGTENQIRARIESMTYLGGSVQLVCSSEIGGITAIVPVESLDAMNARAMQGVVAGWKERDALVLPAASASQEHVPAEVGRV